MNADPFHLYLRSIGEMRPAVLSFDSIGCYHGPMPTEKGGVGMIAESVTITSNAAGWERTMEVPEPAASSIAFLVSLVLLSWRMRTSKGISRER